MMEKFNISSPFIIGERAQILSKISELRSLLSSLSIMIKESDLPAYSPEIAPFDPDKADEHTQARVVIANAIKKLNYEDEQEANESLCFPGFMYANEAMLSQINKINACKTDIEMSFKAFSKIQVTQFGKNYMALDKCILQGTDEARLNKKETYRKIYSALKEHQVKTIGFTWANVPVTKKLNVGSAIRYVERYQLNETQKQSDIALLSELNEFEMVARERRAPTKSRINVTYSDKTLFKNGKKMYTGVLPFFIHEDNLGSTTVYPLNKAIGSKPRAKRRREKLESKPFCRFSPIFRYQEAYREIVLPDECEQEN